MASAQDRAAPRRTHPLHPSEVFRAIGEAERVGAEVLLTDIDVAFTLLRSAAISRDELSGGRDRQIARNAYEMVAAQLKTCPAGFPHRQRIENRLQALGLELTRMGETL
jgi:hypothetical protein